MPGSNAILLAAGLICLVAGGEILVRGAGGLARSMGMSPLLVGLTVVAFATSAPELAVALDATLGGSPGLAVGNVVGSNIANVLLVLGLSAAILPLAVGWEVLRQDIPVVAVVSTLTLALSVDLRLGRVDGLLLMAALAAYLVVTIRRARHDQSGTPEDVESGPATAVSAGSGGQPTRVTGLRIAGDAALISGGVGLLVLGADWLVQGATHVARSFGVSDLIIGLTVVAVGTSLPELATSLIAAARGQRDMAVGNVVGSCLFNLGAVLGAAAVVAPAGVPIEPAAVRFDLPFMLACAIALLPVAFTGLAIARWEGLLFVGYYAAYIAYLVLSATEHPALPAFSAAMRVFVIPLTVITLAVLAVHEVRRGRQEDRPRDRAAS